ncbi:hypothetical protein OG930_03875 [Streptomyces sp. NBC_01799]|nr:hypothetical protein OG930_03875 [Streptomyces sp. NBC_01799]
MERTREQHAELSWAPLVTAEEALSRLVSTWETVEEILGDAWATAGVRLCVANQVAGSIRNREARVVEPHLA